MNEQRRRFCDAYLRHMNASKAAREAGYSDQWATDTGSKLLREPEVKAYLDEHFKAESMGAMEVIRRLTDIARLDLSEIIRDDGTIDIGTMKALGLDRFVKSIGYDSNGNLKVEFMSPEAALERIGKVHKMFGDSNVLSGPGGGPAVVEIQFVRPGEVSAGDTVNSLPNPVTGVLGTGESPV